INSTQSGATEEVKSRSDLREKGVIDTTKSFLSFDDSKLAVYWKKGIYVDRYELHIIKNDAIVAVFRSIDDGVSEKIISSTSMIALYKDADISVKLVTVFEDGEKDFDEFTLVKVNDSDDKNNENIITEDQTNVDTDTKEIANDKAPEEANGSDINENQKSDDEFIPLNINYDNLIYRISLTDESSDYRIILPEKLKDSDVKITMYAKKSNVFEKYLDDKYESVNEFDIKMSSDYKYYVAQVILNNNESKRIFYFLFQD
ncbi:MAG: hypothetical protein KDC67_08845, partial [Ignavibacteriae bacterium]|nr:hypothetical protein [Ignavibacteriota bacterium]